MHWIIKLIPSRKDILTYYELFMPDQKTNIYNFPSMTSALVQFFRDSILF